MAWEIYMVQYEAPAQLIVSNPDLFAVFDPYSVHTRETICLKCCLSAIFPRFHRLVAINSMIIIF